MGEAEVITLWGADQTPYLTRVILGRLRVHIFHRGDADPDCHDHPADFWTFPLISYVEQFRDADGLLGRRVVDAFRLHHRRAEFAHRVIGRWNGARFPDEPRFGRYRRHPRPVADNGQIATLVWWGKKRRDWGFHTAGGWVDWRTYTNAPQALKDAPK